LFLFMDILAKHGEYQTAMRWISMISALYLPLSIVVWFLAGLHNTTDFFAERSKQSLGIINRRMSRVIVSVAMVVMLVALLLPQADGNSLFSGLCNILLEVLVWVVVFITKLIPIFYTDIPDDPHSDGKPTYTPDDSNGSEWGSVIYVLAAAFFAVIALWFIISIINAIRRGLQNYMQSDGTVKSDEVADTDTVEKLERPKSEVYDRQYRRSSAAKVRRIYQKRVISILGNSQSELDSLAPDEITAACMEKGEDISQLTMLYKKARYTESCTAEDLKLARRL